ncbi:MAG: DUF3299 domain-containing protein [Bacteroidetes bacterium]|jgi:hypothetical protein|nr:DUF3299 domain-containing protein [Bacteroidota bacterium]
MKKQLVTVLLSIILSGFLPVETENNPKVSWDTLSKINWVLENGNYKAVFTDEIKNLDGKTVDIQGFMFPLRLGSENSNEFLLTANPVSGCFYCAPGSSNSLVMVYPEEKIEFQFDPVVLEGTFELVPDDFYGLVYQLKNVELKQVL